jgi:hypothetical protein
MLSNYKESGKDLISIIGQQNKTKSNKQRKKEHFKIQTIYTFYPNKFALNGFHR